ncbi:MAG: two-component regulator propeller domain-containing protein, partial [Ignavibacteriaceae bacterium]
MPSTYVVDITQDQEGFIWLGTFDGLVKYDGYQFLTFRNIPGDSTSLNDNSIEAIYVDFTGDLWVGTKSGLNRFESSCDCFFRYFPDPSNPNSLTPGQINTFAEDQSKTLWIGTQQGGLFRYERESDRFTRFLYDPKDLNNMIEDQVRVLLADQNGYLWIGTGEPFDPAVTGGGLIRFNLATGTTKRFRSEPNNPNCLIDDRVSAL